MTAPRQYPAGTRWAVKVVMPASYDAGAKTCGGCEYLDTSTGDGAMCSLFRETAGVYADLDERDGKVVRCKACRAAETT